MSTPQAPVTPSGETKGPMTAAIVITFTAFALVIVTLRAVTRFIIIRRPGLEDYFLVIAMAASIVTGVCQVFQVQYGTGRHFAEVDLADWSTSLKYLFASIVAYNFSLTLTKTAILLQYLRIFTSKIFRVAAYVMMFIVFGYATEAILTAIFNCVPVEAFWTGDPTAKCIPREALWFANAGLNIFTDFSIALLPLPVVIKLNMPRRQKIPLMMIFALGFFICIVSILRLRFLIILSKSMDPTWDQPATAYWSAIEMNISIVCACLPALKPLISLVAPSIFGTTATGSQPPSYGDYRHRSKKISSGGGHGRNFSDKTRRSRSGHGVTTTDEELEMGFQDIEISGGRVQRYSVNQGEETSAYYNNSLHGKPTLVHVASGTTMGGIKQTTVIEQNVIITREGRDSGSESESVRKLVHVPTGKAGEILGKR
ncbi:hypothetical protein H072_7393 [Dactylellina haptotyla CBS 200.50]|uniref:Rhodopsin domain-containing protein n=1 Tax=Dactylellina haptotyla (strain CBS 200.50) TaxID=1284197 RepID=S8BHX0_DACHA|nr:hypothetical protein H072_7393 [Dactylellina haptotyla CBS 200.50]